MWYTLSDTLIVCSLKILSPHGPGNGNLPFHLIISPEQKLWLPAEFTSFFPSCFQIGPNICITFFGHCSTSGEFTCQSPAMKSCILILNFHSFEADFSIRKKKKKKKYLYPAVYRMKHSYVLAAAAGHFAKPAVHMGKCSHAGYHHRCPTNWGSQSMGRWRHLCKNYAGKPVTKLETESPSQGSLLSVCSTAKFMLSPAVLPLNRNLRSFFTSVPWAL